MGLKYSMKLAVVIVGVLALTSLSAMAQDIIRSEVSIEGTGFFTNDSSGNGVLDRATNTGGLLVGYRYNFNRWFAVEANYGYDRNTQMYFGNTLQSAILGAKRPMPGEDVIGAEPVQGCSPCLLACPCKNPSSIAGRLEYERAAAGKPVRLDSAKPWQLHNR